MNDKKAKYSISDFKKPVEENLEPEAEWTNEELIQMAKRIKERLGLTEEIVTKIDRRDKRW